MATIRIASECDCQLILDIYAPFCDASCAVSFEVTPPTIDDMHERVRTTLKILPWLVYEHDGQVRGYAYAGQHKPRAAYNWSVDVSVYLSPLARRQGIGTRLYSCLFEILKLQGYYNVYAGVTLPNPASVGLHKSLGFKDVGVYERVGYKGGAWHDVLWLSRILQPHLAEPVPPVHFEELRKHTSLQKLLGEFSD
jgi:phosphinothricin acetyltransferase